MISKVDLFTYLFVSKLFELPRAATWISSKVSYHNYLIYNSHKDDSKTELCLLDTFGRPGQVPRSWLEWIWNFSIFSPKTSTGIIYVTWFGKRYINGYPFDGSKAFFIRLVSVETINRSVKSFFNPFSIFLQTFERLRPSVRNKLQSVQTKELSVRTEEPSVQTEEPSVWTVKAKRLIEIANRLF